MKKDIYIFACFLAAIFLTGISALDLTGSNLIISERKIDANNISTYVRNSGTFDRNFVTFVAGFEWPKGSGKSAVYSSGFWISGKVNDSIRVSYQDYSIYPLFRAGYFDYNTQTPMGAEDPLFRMYKVSPQFPSGGGDFDSWNVWPVNQGAPWVDVNNNGVYEPPTDHPLMKGSQNLFCSFTDGYRDSASNIRNTPPLKAEIHMYTWAKENQACADAIIYEWTIINKNTRNWTDFSAAIWTDPDLGQSNDDLAGTDSTLGLVYCYNGNNNDPVYGAAPPSVGTAIRFADGHSNYPADFASRWRCPFDCPTDSLQMYRVLHGLRADGSNWINPYNNNLPTKFSFSGDPVNQTGWRDSTPGERYHIIGSVFGNVQSLDTIRFHTVEFIKRGTSNVNSVGELKNCVASVIKVNEGSAETPAGFSLSQNYPNPFNPTTTIAYNLGSRNPVSLKIYDITGREVAVLVDEIKEAGRHEVEFDASGMSSGAYFYQMTAGEYVAVKKLVVLK